MRFAGNTTLSEFSRKLVRSMLRQTKIRILREKIKGEAEMIIPYGGLNATNKRGDWSSSGRSGNFSVRGKWFWRQRGGTWKSRSEDESWARHKGMEGSKPKERDYEITGIPTGKIRQQQICRLWPSASKAALPMEGCEM